MTESRQDYEDIVNLPNPVSKTHPRMPQAARAAQFAPFAALVGYGEALKQVAQTKARQVEEAEFAKIDE